jgi:hypothetical protein
MTLFASSMASADVNYRYLNTETGSSEIDLMQEVSSNISAVVSYPGKLSGICGIVLNVRADSVTISDLLEILRVEAPFPQAWTPKDRMQILDNRTMLVKLYPKNEAYMAVLNVSTRDGSSISKAIQEALPKGGVTTVKISGASCN